MSAEALDRIPVPECPSCGRPVWRVERCICNHLRGEHDIGTKKMPCTTIGPRGKCACKGYQEAEEKA